MKLKQVFQVNSVLRIDSRTYASVTEGTSSTVGVNDGSVSFTSALASSWKQVRQADKQNMSSV